VLPVLDLALPYVEEAQIEVDGRADEGAWGEALVLDDYATFRPDFGQEPTGTLELRLLADEHALHLHFRVDDPEPSRVRASLALWGGLMFRPGWKVLPLFAFNPLESWAMWTTTGELRDLAARPYLWMQFGNGVEGFAFYEEQGQLYEGEWLGNRRAGLELGGGWTR